MYIWYHLVSFVYQDNVVGNFDPFAFKYNDNSTDLKLVFNVK